VPRIAVQGADGSEVAPLLLYLRVPVRALVAVKLEVCTRDFRGKGSGGNKTMQPRDST